MAACPFGLMVVHLTRFSCVGSKPRKEYSVYMLHNLHFVSLHRVSANFLIPLLKIPDNCFLLGKCLGYSPVPAICRSQETLVLGARTQRGLGIGWHLIILHPEHSGCFFFANSAARALQRWPWKHSAAKVVISPNEKSVTNLINLKRSDPHGNP